MQIAYQNTQRLQTLTVQDLIWINLVVTGSVNSFDYETLEQATFRQFGYGGAQDVLGQAAGVLESIVRRRPFSVGNKRTALLACGAFLAMNGMEFLASPEDAQSLIECATGSARERLASVTQPDPDWQPVLVPDVHGTVTRLAERY